MTLALTCQACDTSFELDVAELLDEPRLQCPGCDARASLSVAEGLAGALEDLLGHVARLGSRFALVLELDSEDLPSQLDRRRAAADDEDEEEIEEEDLDREETRDDED
jgi:hypothetical protein